MLRRLGLGLVAALAACAPVVGQQADGVTELARYELKGRHPDLFGVSAVEWDQTGIWLLTDRGALFTGTLSDRGVILNAPTYPSVPLSDGIDAEGLALGPNGLLISSEGPSRVLEVEGDTLFSQRTHAPFRVLRKNRGLEAIAVAENGDIWVLPEVEAPVPVYVRDRDGWFERMRLDLPAGMPTAGGF